MYDYLIVGGGSAGCVLAHRLTEDDDVDVLLLEAGEPQEDRDAVLDPTRVWDILGSDIDWEFETEPQPGMNGRRIPWPRGKALGGSSVINGMAYVRGNAYDYDNWADLGNEGWGYEDLLPYFEKSEQLNASGDAGYHGTDGPLSVSRGEDTDGFRELLLEAGQEAGLEWNADFNGERQAGIGLYHTTIKDGHRHSTAAAFIEPVLDRSSLHVETGARVTEITFDGDRATGVRYDKDGDSHEAEVNDGGEVILSAGAIQSPQLLMLSGIGPAEHLEDVGIDVKLDMPGVGANLQDHLRAPVYHDTKQPIDTDSSNDRDEGATRYDRGIVGAFTYTDEDRPAPDIQYALNAGTWQDTTEGYTIMVIPLRPKSRGRVTLRSDDPYEDPRMDPQYLSEEQDVEDFVNGLREARKVARTDALEEYRGEELAPGEGATDVEITEYIRDNAVSGYHPTCTCKMGDDKLAVVDDELRVHGLKGLRVIDASIMPQITSGNTNAPIIAIAEKGADLVENG